MPRRAAKMATHRLRHHDHAQARSRRADIFGRLDPARVAREIERPLLEDVEDITHEVMDHYQPKLWNMLPEDIRRRIIDRIKADAPGVVRQVMEDVKANLDRVFDLKAMVISNLVHQKPLLNRIFQEAGSEEFRFIARSASPSASPSAWSSWSPGCSPTRPW